MERTQMMKESYLVNCSMLNQNAVFPCKALDIIIQRHSLDTINLVLQVNDQYTSIKTDIHKICFFDHGTLESQSISMKLERDSRIYEDILSSRSREIHWIRVRQQNPDTRLWSMCEIRVFASGYGHRTSLCLEWFYVDIPFSETQETSQFYIKEAE